MPRLPDFNRREFAFRAKLENLTQPEMRNSAVQIKLPDRFKISRIVDRSKGHSIYAFVC